MWKSQDCRDKLVKGEGKECERRENAEMRKTHNHGWKWDPNGVYNTTVNVHNGRPQKPCPEAPLHGRPLWMSAKALSQSSIMRTSIANIHKSPIPKLHYTDVRKSPIPKLHYVDVHCRRLPKPYPDAPLCKHLLRTSVAFKLLHPLISLIFLVYHYIRTTLSIIGNLGDNLGALMIGTKTCTLSSSCKEFTSLLLLVYHYIWSTSSIIGNLGDKLGAWMI